MGASTTAAMQQFSGRANAGQNQNPGLVLLYAENYLNLPAAFPLDKPVNVLGREEGLGIVLPVSAVSRRHAEIIQQAGQFWVRDLGSRNGLLLNGRQLISAKLEPLDELRVGDSILKFVDSDVDGYGHYRIDGALLNRTPRLSPHLQALVGGYQIDRLGADLERIAKAGLSVIVRGASGTGKEMVAQELHRLSQRQGRFCAINCAAIPAQLLESELFGFKRGAFSGAERDKPGLVRSAQGGTLFLDELGDLPLEAQAKLLRVLQSREVLPIGATTPEPVDIRVVCATHRDLKRLESEGRFREDLYARLNEYELVLPPLHERKEDIFLLVRTFLARYGAIGQTLSFAFMTALLHYDWPYNVRELEACIKRALALTQGTALTPELLPEGIQDAMADYGHALPSAAAEGRVEMTESRHEPAPPTEVELRALLTKHHGNVAAVGRELGKARMQIHRWMKRFGVSVEEYRVP